MAKLQRYLQKIFANNSNQVGVFGTGTDKETSKNVETLQSADYENGWSSAIITNKNYPIWQERDGVDYGFSYQLAYLMQAGMPEWLSTETYYTNSFCRYGNDIYYSLQDNNTNHNPALNDGWWMIIDKKFLNKQQVTNCLLEVPQRMDYTLVDGVFTLKAGSVVIVPYGTTDLSSTINVGDTFINDNLKVYDTYWDSINSKFYVYAELQADITRAARAESGNVISRSVHLSFSDSSISIAASLNAVTVTSDANAPATSMFYNTSSNLVKRKSSGTVSTNTCSLPFLTANSNATTDLAEINVVFNGLGYIGTIIWADKGVRGLIPDGRNEDGTLKNTEFTTANFMTYSIPSSLGLSGYRCLALSANSVFSVRPFNVMYDTAKNTIAYSNRNATGAKVGTIISDNDGNITSMSLDGTLNFNALCDGQWVVQLLILATSLTAPTSDVSFDLSGYLPNDGHIYEVLVVTDGQTGATSGNFIKCSLISDISMPAFTFFARTRTASLVNGAGSVILPIGMGRTLTVQGVTANTGSMNIYIEGYRRVGTNI